jgi:hypothetical protein
MKDVLEQVGVGAARNRLEEITADELAAGSDRGRQRLFRGFDDVRKIEQDSAGVRRNRWSSSSAKTPKPASARRTRYRESACEPLAAANSATGLGPAAR